MIRHTHRVCALAGGSAFVLLCAACGSSRPLAPQQELPATDSGGDSTAGTLPTQPQGGSPDADGALDGLARGDGTPAEASVPGASCTEGSNWVNQREWIADAIDRFGGVSGDGRTVAWTRTTGEVMAADRLGEASDFMTPDQVPQSTDPLLPQGRAALDSTGTLLLAVDSTGVDFVVWQRSAWGQAWTMGSPSAFAQVVPSDAAPGSTVSEPMFGASGVSFFFLLTPGGGGDASTAMPVLYESPWDAASSAWGPGVAITQAELSSTATQLRRPTGASTDDLTLFFFDEVALVERAAWRADPSSPFIHFEDVPAAPDAAPNGGCALLYYRGTDPRAGTQGVNTAYVAAPGFEAGVGDSGADATAGEDASGGGDAGVDDAPEGGCAAGAMRCLRLVPEVCDDAGAWESAGAECSGSTPVCLAGACVECSPDAIRCNGQQPEICPSSGAWQSSGPSCDSILETCASGSCVGSCVPASTQCSGDQPQTCDSAGQWQNTGSPCTGLNQGCIGGSCMTE